MLITNHVLVGAAVGYVVTKPSAAFPAGIVSHFVCDALPHWGNFRSDRQFLAIAVPDGLLGLTTIGVLTAATPPERRAAVLSGITGACLPDLNKPNQLFFGRTFFPPAVDSFHGRIQSESPRRAPLEIAVAAGMWVLVRHLARRSRARSTA